VETLKIETLNHSHHLCLQKISLPSPHNPTKVLSERRKRRLTNKEESPEDESSELNQFDNNLGVNDIREVNERLDLTGV
jgi:hypothetical protein